MHVRLAFAVAAHLEPEILIIDEVLAVGDVEFQRKCLGKMNDAARSGRTVLFVSHNMPAVESLCTTAVLLERGELVELGPTADVIRLYQRTAVAATDTTCSLIDHSGRGSDANPLMRSVTLRDSQGHTTSSFRMGASLSVEVEFKAPRPLSPVLGIVVKTDVGAAVFGVDNRMVSGFCFDDGVTNGTIVCQIDDLPLSPATYWLDLYLGDRHRSLDRIRDAIPFEVLAADVFGSGKVPPRHCGPICWPAVWELRSGSPATEAALVD
jgi:lipopolysaccharide transport system ATP-binding protein